MKRFWLLPFTLLALASPLGASNAALNATSIPDFVDNRLIQNWYQDLFEMAAAYVFPIALNHPFIDGNKRVGTMAADVFLELNGFSIPSSTETTFERIVLEVAQGKAEKSEVAAFFRKHSKKSRA